VIKTASTMRFARHLSGLSQVEGMPLLRSQSPGFSRFRLTKATSFLKDTAFSTYVRRKSDGCPSILRPGILLVEFGSGPIM
jgi:hypothetical protein